MLNRKMEVLLSENNDTKEELIKMQEDVIIR